MDISFFLTKPAPKRKPEPEDDARARLTKAECATVRAYFAASPDDRKRILRSQANEDEKAKLTARRRWRREYQRRYREMQTMATLIL